HARFARLVAFRTALGLPVALARRSGIGHEVLCFVHKWAEPGNPFGGSSGEDTFYARGACGSSPAASGQDIRTSPRRPYPRGTAHVHFCGTTVTPDGANRIVTCAPGGNAPARSDATTKSSRASPSAATQYSIWLPR